MFCLALELIELELVFKDGQIPIQKNDEDLLTLPEHRPQRAVLVNFDPFPDLLWHDSPSVVEATQERTSLPTSGPYQEMGRDVVRNRRNRLSVSNPPAENVGEADETVVQGVKDQRRARVRIVAFPGGLEVLDHRFKIGRASCRERVCQYV